MSSSQDETLREASRALDRLAAQTEAARRQPSRLARLLRRGAVPAEVKTVIARKRDRRSDFMTAALGVTLGLICALFPWYIFFNPDEFGVRAITFGGDGEFLDTPPIILGDLPIRVGAPSSVEQIPQPDLDLLATGTTAAQGEQDVEEHGTLGLSQQPFPVAPIAYKLVHVANGRAMIEDDGGLFVVQVGSMLPDSSLVTSIEERAGRWVMVTDADKVIEIEP